MGYALESDTLSAVWSSHSCQACRQVRTMQGRLEEVLCRGRSTSEDEILSHWRTRNWFREEETLELGLEDFKRRAFQVKEEQEQKLRHRLGIFGAPTCAVGGSWPILNMAQ